MRWPNPTDGALAAQNEFRAHSDAASMLCLDSESTGTGQRPGDVTSDLDRMCDRPVHGK